MNFSDSNLQSVVVSEEYIEYKFGEMYQEIDGAKRATTISCDVIGEVERFKYLGFFVQKDGNFVMNVKHRISTVARNREKRRAFYMIKELQ